MLFNFGSCRTGYYVRQLSESHDLYMAAAAEFDRRTPEAGKQPYQAEEDASAMLLQVYLGASNVTAAAVQEAQ